MGRTFGKLSLRRSIAVTSTLCFGHTTEASHQGSLQKTTKAIPRIKYLCNTKFHTCSAFSERIVRLKDGGQQDACRPEGVCMHPGNVNTTPD